MVLIALAMMLSTLFSSVATATPLDDRREASAAWMSRSKELSRGVRIEDLQLVSIVGSDGGKVLAVIGRAVNQNTVALSLLAIHMTMSGQGAPSGNVAILRGKGDTIAAGASRNFGFAFDAGATSGFAPLDPLPAKTSPISEEDARRLGNVSAYVTYAAE